MSNLNFNKVILCGRITADPELKKTQSGLSVLTFSLAVNRRFKRGENGQNEAPTDFITCVAWRATAEFISIYFNKGSSITITGSLQTRTWIDNTGNKRYFTEVLVDEAYFVDSRNDSKQGNQVDTYVPDVNGSPSFTSDIPNFEEVKTDDDLPF